MMGDIPVTQACWVDALSCSSQHCGLVTGIMFAAESACACVTEQSNYRKNFIFHLLMMVDLPTLRGRKLCCDICPQVCGPLWQFSAKTSSSRFSAIFAKTSKHRSFVLVCQTRSRCGDAVRRRFSNIRRNITAKCKKFIREVILNQTANLFVATFTVIGSIIYFYMINCFQI